MKHSDLGEKLILKQKSIYYQKKERKKEKKKEHFYNRVQVNSIFEEVQAKTENLQKDLQETSFQNCYQQWQQRIQKCVNAEGDYFEVAAVTEWSRYGIVAGLATSSSLVPLKILPVRQQCTLNLSRAETSSRWCGVVVRRVGCQLRYRPRYWTMAQNYVVRHQKPSCS
ncbi:uncharacterized protein TNCV_1019831 [Trichonephila clavipes]|nr:uncharacterized protein TNCV_1019831 [Trichonephila clavipes]